MNYFEPTDKQRSDYEAWVDSRPKVVADMARKFPPWALFRMKATGHSVFALAFNENVTMTVAVTGKFNLVDFERRVFGIAPESLEPCELPQPNEPLGTLLDEDQTQALLLKLEADGPTCGCEGPCAVKHAKHKHDRRGTRRGASTATGTTGATRERRSGGTRRRGKRGRQARAG